MTPLDPQEWPWTRDEVEQINRVCVKHGWKPEAMARMALASNLNVFELLQTLESLLRHERGRGIPS